MSFLTGITSGGHDEAKDVGRGAKDADVAADPGVPLRDDLSVCAHRALPGLRNLERYATHGGLQVTSPATGELRFPTNHKSTNAIFWDQTNRSNGPTIPLSPLVTADR